MTTKEVADYQQRLFEAMQDEGTATSEKIQFQQREEARWRERAENAKFLKDHPELSEAAKRWWQATWNRREAAADRNLIIFLSMGREGQSFTRALERGMVGGSKVEQERYEIPIAPVIIPEDNFERMCCEQHAKMRAQAAEQHKKGKAVISMHGQLPPSHQRQLDRGYEIDDITAAWDLYDRIMQHRDDLARQAAEFKDSRKMLENAPDWVKKVIQDHTGK